METDRGEIKTVQEKSQKINQSNEIIEKITEENAEGDKKTEDGKKKSTPGVIYLSRIPTKMNVRLIRDYFSKYGTVDRIYLEPKGGNIINFFIQDKSSF
jgi:RNA recognition motif-containing protein